MYFWLLHSSKYINSWLWGSAIWNAHIETSSNMGQSPTLVSIKKIIDFSIFRWEKWNYKFPYFLNYLKKLFINQYLGTIEELYNYIGLLSPFKKSCINLFPFPKNWVQRFRGKWYRYHISLFSQSRWKK